MGAASLSGVPPMSSSLSLNMLSGAMPYKFQHGNQ